MEIVPILPQWEEFSASKAIIKTWAGLTEPTKTSGYTEHHLEEIRYCIDMAKLNSWLLYQFYGGSMDYLAFRRVITNGLHLIEP